MVVTAKHCPGSGSAPLDNHMILSALPGTREEILRRDMLPYLHLIRNTDISGIMVGQVYAPAIDPDYPSTLSRKTLDFIHEQGFEGFTVTDSFTMASLRNKYPLEDCIRLAMIAGNDMVMNDYRTDTRTAYEIMLKVYHDGDVTEEQIDRCVARVLRAQNRTMAPARQKTIPEADDIVRRIAEKSITVRLNGCLEATLDTKEKYLVIIQKGNLFQHPVSGKIEEENAGLMDTVEKDLRAAFTNSEFISIPEFPSAEDIKHILRIGNFYEHIIVAAWTTSSSYFGSADLSNRFLGFMESIAEKTDALILFGTPHAARLLPPLRRIVFGYDAQGCGSFAVKVLTGEHKATGKLPVKVDFRTE